MSSTARPRFLPWRRAATGDLALEHRHEALGIGGVAGLDDDDRRPD